MPGYGNLITPQKNSKQHHTYLPNFPMIPLRSFSEESLILRKLLRVRERNPIHALKRVVILVAEEVRCRALDSINRIRLWCTLEAWHDIKAKKSHDDHGTRAHTLSTEKALIRPVCGTCGPTHKSTMGPHRYTVVDVPSAIFVCMICTLYLLY